MTVPLTADGIAQVFEGCADFGRRTLYLGDDPQRAVEMLYIVGQVRNERASDYVLRPLTQCKDLAEVATLDEAYDRMAKGCLYSLAVEERTTADQVVFDLVNGWVALFFPGKDKVLTLMTATEEKRSISPPDNEPDVKGSMDCFVESIRTNTSLVRRRLRAPELRIWETFVGRQSVTPVDVLYIKGITDPKLARQVEEQVAAIDLDAMLMTGNLEQYMVGEETRTPFPMSLYTQRPDRFCAGLAEGRGGALVDGIPKGWRFPATLDSLYRTGQDRSTSWMVASALSVLRYLCMLVTLFLPGLYVAAVLYHPELIPVKLMLSIISAKADVPFSTLAEVLVMLIAFEVVQEAGLRLPAAIGQTVSILGGLVVGSAAVEAKLVSPAVLVMVAIVIWGSALASAFIDNIPFAATMIPVIRSLAATQGVPLDVMAWTLAMGTDIGGNATPIGASANVVGTAIAAKSGHPIGWGKYCRIMAPATVLVVAISMMIIFIRYF